MTFLFKNSACFSVVNFVRANKLYVMLCKAHLENFLLIYGTVFGFLKNPMVGVIFFVMYGNVLRVKYLMNKFTFESFKRFNDSMDKFLNQKYFPKPLASVVRKIRDLIVNLVKVDPKP